MITTHQGRFYIKFDQFLILNYHISRLKGYFLVKK